MSSNTLTLYVYAYNLTYNLHTFLGKIHANVTMLQK